MNNSIELSYSSENIYEKINDIDAKSLISEKNNILKLIYKYENEISSLKDLIDYIDNQIYNKCEHEWDYDPPSCVYDRGSYVCTKCRCYKR